MDSYIPLDKNIPTPDELEINMKYYRPEDLVEDDWKEVWVCTVCGKTNKLYDSKESVRWNWTGIEYTHYHHHNDNPSGFRGEAKCLIQK